MKKLFAALLAVLLLCGCTSPQPADSETQGETQPETAMKTYDLPVEMCQYAVPMGEDVLLFSGGEETTLVKLDGQDLKQTASFQLGSSIDPNDPAVRCTADGVAYRDGGEVVFLDAALTEIQRIALPENTAGDVAVSDDLNTIYYTTDTSLRAVDRDTGIDRLLRESIPAGLTITGLHLDSTVLQCTIPTDGDASASLFYSAVTGELLQSYSGSVTLTSSGTSWLAILDQSQVIFGTGEEAPKSFTPPADCTAVGQVSGMDAIAVTAHEGDHAQLILYSLDTGSKIRSMTMVGEFYLRNVWGDTENNCVWFLRDAAQLCRMDLEDEASEEDASCIGPYYSRENPDTEGLAALEPILLDMEETYGVEIHIYEDAVAVQPDGMILDCEYQVDVLTEGLETLCLALDNFTPEFLANAGRASDDGRVHISLVRAVDSTGCIQFWDGEGIARIVLAIDGDLQRSFFHGLGHIIDARVMSECTAFDSWKRLNPKGFSYSGDASAGQDAEAYPGTFADPRGMVSPVEDRAWVFAHAILADMDATFESQTMQKKLSTLCTGIRKAFGLKNSEEVLPWEQYLAQ